MAITHTLYGFKTGYLQKAVRLEDVATLSTEVGDTFKIGQLCNLTAANGTTPAYLSKDTAPAVGDYIIAQGADTVGYGHVLVEEKNYKPKGYIAVTEDTAMDASSITVPIVIVYQVTDVNDVVKIG